MSINVVWDNEGKTIIRYDFEGRWTWDEFHTATVEAFAMTRSVEHRVDSISHFKAGAALPPNALFQFRKAMVNAPKNRGKTIIVGATAFIKAMVSVFSQLNRQLGERLGLADTLDEARKILSVSHK